MKHLYLKTYYENTYFLYNNDTVNFVIVLLMAHIIIVKIYVRTETIQYFDYL